MTYRFVASLSGLLLCVVGISAFSDLSYAETQEQAARRLLSVAQDIKKIAQEKTNKLQNEYDALVKEKNKLRYELDHIPLPHGEHAEAQYKKRVESLKTLEVRTQDIRSQLDVSKAQLSSAKENLTQKQNGLGVALGAKEAQAEKERVALAKENMRKAEERLAREKQTPEERDAHAKELSEAKQAVANIEARLNQTKKSLGTAPQARPYDQLTYDQKVLVASQKLDEKNLSEAQDKLKGLVEKTTSSDYKVVLGKSGSLEAQEAFVYNARLNEVDRAKDKEKLDAEYQAAASSVDTAKKSVDIVEESLKRKQEQIQDFRRQQHSGILPDNQTTASARQKLEDEALQLKTELTKKQQVYTERRDTASDLFAKQQSSKAAALARNKKREDTERKFAIQKAAAEKEAEFTQAIERARTAHNQLTERVEKEAIDKARESHDFATAFAKKSNERQAAIQRLEIGISSRQLLGAVITPQENKRLEEARKLDRMITESYNNIQNGAKDSDPRFDKKAITQFTAQADALLDASSKSPEEAFSKLAAVQKEQQDEYWASRNGGKKKDEVGAESKDGEAAKSDDAKKGDTKKEGEKVAAKEDKEDKNDKDKKDKADEKDLAAGDSEGVKEKVNDLALATEAVAESNEQKAAILKAKVAHLTLELRTLIVKENKDHAETVREDQLRNEIAATNVEIASLTQQSDNLVVQADKTRGALDAQKNAALVKKPITPASVDASNADRAPTSKEEGVEAADIGDAEEAAGLDGVVEASGGE